MVKNSLVTFQMSPEEQKEFYDKNGYIVLKNAIPPEEFEALSKDYDDLFASQANKNLEATWPGQWRNEKVEKQQVTVATL